MTWSCARPSHSQIAQTTGSWLSTMQAAMHCSKKQGLSACIAEKQQPPTPVMLVLAKKCSGPRKAHDLSKTSFRMPRPANHFQFSEFRPNKAHRGPPRKRRENAEMRRGQTPRNAKKLPGHALVALICLRLTNSEERCVEWWFAINLM